MGYPMPPVARRASVFLTPKISEARKFADVSAEINGDGTGAILRVSVPAAIASTLIADELDYLGYRSEQPIPAQYIKVAREVPARHESLINI